MTETDYFPRRSLRDIDRFIPFVQKQLSQRKFEPFSFDLKGDLRRISAVLFLLGLDSDGQMTLILNKRSRFVRQPGDLCCPGGGITPGVDTLLARCLDLPLSPLSSWFYRNQGGLDPCRDCKKLRLLLATALREGVEEMRINPFGISYLGRLPEQQLLMFQRSIFPLVGWVRKQKRFFPNWEVERIVRIPMLSLMDQINYARFRLQNDPQAGSREMPCFVYRDKGQPELLWGATYRMTMQFLDTVFGFPEPSMPQRPRVHYSLADNYRTGSKT